MGYPYDDLKDYLAALTKAGLLHRVPVPVDPTRSDSETSAAALSREIVPCIEMYAKLPFEESESSLSAAAA